MIAALLLLLATPGPYYDTHYNLLPMDTLYCADGDTVLSQWDDKGDRLWFERRPRDRFSAYVTQYREEP